MQTAYRCKHCKFVYVSKVSSCDCQGSKKFEYTLVQIIDVPENEHKVPDFKELKHSRGPRFVNYRNGTYGNGIYEYQGSWEDGRPRVGILGNISSSYDNAEVSFKVAEENRNANCVLAAAGPVMLEALYMCFQYFNRKRLVQGDSPQTDMRIKIIAEAIHQGTDLSVFNEPQDPPKD